MSDWHESASLSSTAVCAGLASVVTKTVLFPMDTIKCRLMANGSMGNLRTFRVFNGLLPKISLYAPYQALYMTTYTAMRDNLDPALHPSLRAVMAGVTAELVGSVIRVPMEAIKQQMQAGVIASNRDLLRLLVSDPFRFYRLRNFVAQTLVHDLPCGAVHWVVYERIKRTNEAPVFLSGAAAGAAAALLTNPLDVVKTRMITKPAEHRTVGSTVRVLLAQGGPRIFLTGVVPRILHLSPNSAIYMFVFDLLYRHAGH